MRTGRRILLTMTLLLTAACVIACQSSSLRVGWRAFDGLRRKRARYTSFTGVERKSFRAEAGQMIELDYEVEVEEGTLTVQLLDPDHDRVFHKAIREDAADVVPVSAPRSGRYEVRIEGDATKGSYDVSWDVSS